MMLNSDLPVSGPQYFMVEKLWDQSERHGQIMNTGCEVML